MTKKIAKKCKTLKVKRKVKISGKSKTIQVRRKVCNPRFPKKVENEIVESAIYTANSGFGQNEHPIRSAEMSAKGAVDYFFEDVKHTKKDLEDAFNLYMDVFMYCYFGILKNPKIKNLVNSFKHQTIYRKKE